ncbi:WecB/TagA/CpsF family glycosyltransferase [Hyphomonas sp.]|uniref:WecB/TagA/CpsF family glycosyltransferase n=1 Tax=Hyphomonas sp. TaxID=87 RepID=UPI0035270D5F
MDKQATRFLGLDFQPMTTAEATRFLAETASAGAPFTYVVTPNVDHRIRLEREPELRPLYDAAGLLLNDSRILELLARRDGIDLPASPGADIVEALFAGVIRPDETVTIVGGDAALEAALKARYGLTDLRRHEPPFGMRKNPDAIAAAAAFLAANPARFHFLCVGSPQQEMVAHAALELGTATGVGLCCGASLDFLSGKTDRAPAWMRQARLEWLHRLGSEPGRLARRYLVEGPAIFRIWRRDRRG